MKRKKFNYKKILKFFEKISNKKKILYLKRNKKLTRFLLARKIKVYNGKKFRNLKINKFRLNLKVGSLYQTRKKFSYLKKNNVLFSKS